MDYAFDSAPPLDASSFECVVCASVTGGVLVSATLIGGAISLFQSMKADDGRSVANGIAGSIVLLCGASILCCTAVAIGALAKNCLKKKSYQELPDSNAQKV